jgi:hypothetical protein
MSLVSLRFGDFRDVVGHFEARLLSLDPFCMSLLVARSASWGPADGVLVRVLHMRCVLADLAPEAQAPEEPRAKPARWLA